MATTITAANLGAWLLRCNADGVWDLPGFIEDGGDSIDNWSVVDNYRSRMMKPGDRVLFWVSGNGRRMARGIWGTGYVAGYVQDVLPDVDDAGEVSYWFNEAARVAVTNSIDVDIPLFDSAVTDTDLRATGVDYLEVQRQPQGSNPSWISIDELADLEALLPPWPDQPDAEEKIIVTDGRGAGFGDAAANAIVEAAAMATVTEYYEAGDWKVVDVSHQRMGWDLTCTSATGETARVEVKGLRGDRPVVLLTANEIRSAKSDDGWILAVVTRALSTPHVTEFEAPAAIATAEAYLYRADLARLTT